MTLCDWDRICRSQPRVRQRRQRSGRRVERSKVAFRECAKRSRSPVEGAPGLALHALSPKRSLRLLRTWIQKQATRPQKEQPPEYGRIIPREACPLWLRADLVELTGHRPGTRSEVPPQSCFQPRVRGSRLRPDECKRSSMAGMQRTVRRIFAAQRCAKSQEEQAAPQF